MEDQPSQEQIEAIEAALVSGGKIEAIKVYREATGKGLKESKEFIEALIAKLAEHDPETYGKLTKGGCASILMVLVAVVSVATATIFAASRIV